MQPPWLQLTIQLYGVLHPLRHNSFFYLTEMTSHRVVPIFSICAAAFWADLFVKFHNFLHVRLRLLELLWLIMWVSVVAQWYFKCIFFVKSHLHCLRLWPVSLCSTGPALMQTELQFTVH